MTPSRYRSVRVYVQMRERLLWRVGATDMSSTRGPGTVVPCSQLKLVFFPLIFPVFTFVLISSCFCYFFLSYFYFFMFPVIFSISIFYSFNPMTGKLNTVITCQLGPLFTRGHDDVIKWKHFPRYWPFVRGIHRSPVNSPHKGQWRGALMFSFICVWINAWANNRKAGDLRRYRAHYDVTVMVINYTSNVFRT